MRLHYICQWIISQSESTHALAAALIGPEILCWTDGIKELELATFERLLRSWHFEKDLYQSESTFINSFIIKHQIFALHPNDATPQFLSRMFILYRIAQKSTKSYPRQSEHSPLSSAEASFWRREAGKKEKESARSMMGRGKREVLSIFPLLLFLLGYSAWTLREEREHSLRKLTPLFIEYLI